MKKFLPTILIVLAIVVVVGFVVFAMTRSDAELNQTNEATKELSAADKEALRTGGTMGNTNATVVVTEFGDYQCPACGQWHPFIKDSLLPAYQDKILFVFKNLPLSIHKNAQPAAQAVEAAALQGKFWEMHNIMYEKQKEWENEADPKSKFEVYAREIGLDIDRWKSDFDSSKVKDLIKNDVALADKLKLPGTPAFLINGALVSPKNFDDLKQAIDKALANAQAPQPPQ